MSQIGSFALMLALGLSAYSFLAGLLALFNRNAASARLGETARRAGIATFAAVLIGEPDDQLLAACYLGRRADNAGIAVLHDRVAAVKRRRW